ncbi:MAG TPA: CPBP family intramembrane glutamic endopeptidase [Thermomicrobiales bacterium]|nr:CPBP family intramembrane glutamic endopeptidase [Thermomicrobiales bacterium]
MGGELVDVIGMLLSALALVGSVAFFCLWAHRAEGNRALTMGLYIVFGAFGFFVLLYGLGSAYRSYLEGEPVGNISYLAAALGLIAGIGLIPPLRLLVTKVVPFDPHSKPDMVGFIVLSQIAVLSIVALAADDGEFEPLTYPYLVIQAAAFIAVAFLLVGTWIYRSPRSSLERLGLVRPTQKQVWISVGFVFVLFIVSITSSLLVSEFQPEIGDEITDNLGRMTENIETGPGALLLGVTSGAGEEILVRGAIQPRYGIAFTSLLFAVLHAQYGLSFVTAGVFVTGVVFGLERKYLNTTCCIITHSLYNTTAVAVTLVIA